MSWTYLDDSERTARKDYRCLTCNEVIPKGSRYHRRTGVEHGEGYCTMRMHPECNKATAHWTNEDWEIFSGIKLKRGTDEEA